MEGKLFNLWATKGSKFDRRTRPGSKTWSVLVIHLIREKNNVESGRKKPLFGLKMIVFILKQNVFGGFISKL